MGVDAGQNAGGAGAGAGAGNADAGQGAGGQSGTGDAGQGQGSQKTGGSTPNFQDAINAIIARERADADRRVAEAVASRTAPASGTGTGTTGTTSGTDDAAFRAQVEAARKPLEDKLSAETARTKALHDRLIKQELRAAAGDAVDPEEVAERLAKNMRVTEQGTFEVVDADGRPVYGEKGLLGPKDLVGKLLAEKPYLAKSQVRDGANFGAADRQAPGTSDIEAKITAAEKAGNHSLAIALKEQQLLKLMGR